MQMFENVVVGPGLTINCPEVFKDPMFIEWLNNESPKMTWHQGGNPSEWSDVVVMVDPTLNGEGTDSDMPEHVWSAIVSACKTHLGIHPTPSAHIHVRLTNC